MARIDQVGKTFLFKIIYYGVSEEALTGNLSRIVENTGAKVAVGETQDPRLAYTSALELSLGVIQGWNTVMFLQTAPPLSLPAARLLTLKQSDGVVFVASPERQADNCKYLNELRNHINKLDYHWDTFPVVVQKEIGVEDDLDIGNLPCLNANVVTGEGVMETLRLISKKVLIQHKNL